ARGATVRGHVLVGPQLGVAAKHADLRAVELDHQAAGLRECRDLSHHLLGHLRLLASHRARRYHMARSNRLRSTARSISLTATTTSVGVTFAAATGANASPASIFAA